MCIRTSGLCTQSSYPTLHLAVPEASAEQLLFLYEQALGVCISSLDECLNKQINLHRKHPPKKFRPQEEV
jgi:hypothetical protein